MVDQLAKFISAYAFIELDLEASGKPYLLFRRQQPWHRYGPHRFPKIFISRYQRRDHWRQDMMLKEILKLGVRNPGFTLARPKNVGAFPHAGYKEILSAK
ncbi:MAG: hypothetical protein ABSG31_18745 [Tepidisphaeraceae bacterium]